MKNVQLFFGRFSKIRIFQTNPLFLEWGNVLSILEVSAREVASSIPLELVEEYLELFPDIIWPIYKNQTFSNFFSLSDSGKVWSLLELSAPEVKSFHSKLVEEYPVLFLDILWPNFK